MKGWCEAERDALGVLTAVEYEDREAGRYALNNLEDPRRVAWTLAVWLSREMHRGVEEIGWADPKGRIELAGLRVAERSAA